MVMPIVTFTNKPLCISISEAVKLSIYELIQKIKEAFPQIKNEVVTFQMRVNTSVSDVVDIHINTLASNFKKLIDEVNSLAGTEEVGGYSADDISLILTFEDNFLQGCLGTNPMTTYIEGKVGIDQQLGHA